MFGFLPNVIKRSGCFWSLQLLLWNTTFTETSLYWMLKETGSLFDTNRCAFAGLGLCSRRTAMEEGDVLFCPWSLTSTIALCSFWFSVVPVDNHMWRNLNTMVKENWKVNMKNKNAIKVEIKVCLPNKQLLGLNRSHEIIRTFFFFSFGKETCDQTKQNKTVQNPGIQSNWICPSKLSWCPFPLSPFCFNTSIQHHGGRSLVVYAT